MPTIPYTLLQAIAREEGFYVDGSRPARNFNPGDLEWQPWMIPFGASGGDPRFAIFTDANQGFAALRHLFGFPLYRGTTISEAMGHYLSGESGPDIAQYILNICSFCEVTPDTIIDGIIG